MGEPIVLQGVARAHDRESPVIAADARLSIAGKEHHDRTRHAFELVLDDGSRVRVDVAAAELRGRPRVRRGSWAKVRSAPEVAGFADVAPGPHVTVRLVWRGILDGERITVRGDVTREVLGEVAGYREAGSARPSEIRASELETCAPAGGLADALLAIGGRLAAVARDGWAGVRTAGRAIGRALRACGRALLASIVLVWREIWAILLLVAWLQWSWTHAPAILVSIAFCLSLASAAYRYRHPTPVFRPLARAETTRPATRQLTVVMSLTLCLTLAGTSAAALGFRYVRLAVVVLLLLPLVLLFLRAELLAGGRAPRLLLALLRAPRLGAAPPQGAWGARVGRVPLGAGTPVRCAEELADDAREARHSAKVTAAPVHLAHASGTAEIAPSPDGRWATTDRRVQFLALENVRQRREEWIRETDHVLVVGPVTRDASGHETFRATGLESVLVFASRKDARLAAALALAGTVMTVGGQLAALALGLLAFAR